MSLLSMFGLTPAPSDDFWYQSAGTRTAAGISVDENVAMTYSACWAATMLLSTSGGMLPLKLYRRSAAGGSEAAVDDPRYGLMHDSPNDEMTSMMFRSSRIAQQVNRGNAFAEIERTRGGLPLRLHPIHASRIPARNIVRENGTLMYYVKNDDASTTPIPAADMLHVPSPISNDGVVGLGVVEHARLTIGLGLATETQGAAYFGNSARPKIIIKGGTFKDKADREDFRNQWNEVHGGPDNNAKPALLPNGADITALSFNANDSQFLETRQHNTEEIARWYGVPPHLIGHLLRSTNNNIEHQSLEFVKYSLMRWLVLWEQELNRKLLRPGERATMYFKHSVDALERADLLTRTNALKDEFFNGKRTLNEWRAMDEQNPIGPLGDLHFVQSAMVPLEIAAQGPQKPVAPKDRTEDDDLSAKLLASMESLQATVATGLTRHANAVQELRVEAESKDEARRIELEHLRSLQEQQALTAAERLNAINAAIIHQSQQQNAVQTRMAQAMVRDVMSRMLSVEINNVKRTAEKASRFDARLREFYGKHASALERNLSEPVAVLLACRGDEREAPEVAKNIAERHVAESLRQLDALLDCQAEELAGKVDECVSRWHEERTEINLEDEK